MPQIRIVFDGKQAGRKFKASMVKRGKQINAAADAAAQFGAAEIQKRGRINIINAGNFGTRWIEGFTATVARGGSFLLIRVQQAVKYWRVFQYGNITRGRPLLWIPLSFATDAKGVMARDFPGKLFRVDRPGKAPLLLEAGSGEPKYFGKESVTIPKKFRLIEIAAEVSRELPKYYRRAMREIGKR